MALYAAAAVLSAFLLFLVQPMAGKALLPQFGGTSAVWSVCLLFFQCLLVAGYWYSHRLVEGLFGKRQAVVHAGLLAASAALLLSAAELQPPPSPRFPTVAILLRLALMAGLPFFALSATTPLVQAWYSRRYGAQLPYRLFAVSNAGSLAGLASYPFLIEPNFGLGTQKALWAAGFVVFAVLCGVAAFRGADREGSPAGGSVEAEGRPTRRRKVIWLLLAAVGSALLMTVTNLLTKDVAPVPLLWVLPLSLYLLSFILCFAPGPWYHHRVFSRLSTFGWFALAYGLAYSGSGMNLAVLGALLCGGLFVCCMYCHGELALLKPAPAHLTSFYLMVSLGGALGGAFVALASPHLFRDYYEFPLVLAVGAALGFHVGERNLAALVRLFLTLFLVGYVSHVVFLGGRRVVWASRNFYGPLKVIESGSGRDHMLTLLNGTISHGSQFTEASLRRRATTYYGPRSGGALAIRYPTEGGKRVGLVGLGPGTMAAYGRKGDYYRFYEINPLVIRAAREKFTYLADCEAEVEIVEGDARLSMQREPDQHFDVLILDAFSGDSIPAHLLTREAFRIYYRHLKPGGILAVHISNRYLNLAPLLTKTAAETGRASRTIISPGDPAEGTHRATWVLITEDNGRLEAPAFQANAVKIEPPGRLRVWTDDYSNLLAVLR